MEMSLAGVSVRRVKEPGCSSRTGAWAYRSSWRGLPGLEVAEVRGAFLPERLHRRAKREGAPGGGTFAAHRLHEVGNLGLHGHGTPRCHGEGPGGKALASSMSV